MLRVPPTRGLRGAQITIFLHQLKQMGIALSDVSAEDVVEGRPALILSLTWQLITHLLINDLAPSRGTKGSAGRRAAAACTKSGRSATSTAGHEALVANTLLDWLHANSSSIGSAAWRSGAKGGGDAAMHIERLGGWADAALCDGRAFCALLQRFDPCASDHTRTTRIYRHP